MAQSVEHVIGNDEVTGPIPVTSSRKALVERRGLFNDMRKEFQMLKNTPLGVFFYHCAFVSSCIFDLFAYIFLSASRKRLRRVDLPMSSMYS